MTVPPRSVLTPAAIALLSTVFLTAAVAQEREGFFNQFFGGNERQAAPPVQPVQMSPSELVMRLERLENAVRQLTGNIEQLQHRNQQLEQQLQRLGGAPPQAQQGMPPAPQAGPQGRPQPMQPPPAQPQRRSDAGDPNDNPVSGGPRPIQRRADAYDPTDNLAAPGAPRPMGRRGDVFDPNENPNAPGAPRVLGSIPANPTVIAGDPDDDRTGAPPIGAPGGRQAGAPLDLSTLSGQAASDPSLAPPTGGAPYVAGSLPAPPPRQMSATGAPMQQQAALPPSQTPKDEYDLGYGYVLRRDYALAEETFRGFLRKYPTDRLAAEANYWLGESLFQRQRYRDAAESFLNVSTKFDKSGKAPDALLRLGQSLAALKEKEAACATFSELGRKYPRASPTVKQAAEREQKRAGC